MNFSIEYSCRSMKLLIETKMKHLCFVFLEQQELQQKSISILKALLGIPANWVDRKTCSSKGNLELVFFIRKN